MNKKSHPCFLKKKPKQTIYWGINDVAFNSSETLTGIINNKFNTPEGLPTKNYKDIKNWENKAVNRKVTTATIKEILSSAEFWDKLSIRSEFIDLCNKKIFKGYNNCFITFDPEQNLKDIRHFLSLNFEYSEHFDLIKPAQNGGESKINMKGAILIDSDIKNLIKSNASIKILITNNIDTCYNNAFGEYTNQDISNIYIVSDLSQVQEILEFNLKNNLLSI